MVTTEAPDPVAQPQASTFRARPSRVMPPEMTRRATLTLDENEPERVDHAEVSNAGRLTDHFQKAQPLDRVEIRPYNAEADKDCAGSKPGRGRPGEEYHLNLEDPSYQAYTEGIKIWIRMQEKSRMHLRLANLSIPSGAIGNSPQDKIRPFQRLSGDEKAGLGSASNIDDGDEQAPMRAWWKGMSDGARYCVTILSEKMYF